MAPTVRKGRDGGTTSSAAARKRLGSGVKSLFLYGSPEERTRRRKRLGSGVKSLFKLADQSVRANLMATSSPYKKVAKGLASPIVEQRKKRQARMDAARPVAKGVSKTAELSPFVPIKRTKRVYGPMPGAKKVTRTTTTTRGR